jgi:hypothetical protein
MLDDGRYDVIVVDARENADKSIELEIAVASGARRGDMVTITATHMSRGVIDLLAMPATLIVDDGEPRLVFDS